MSSENEDQHLPSQPTEMNNGAQKEIRFSYTREFLLSLSDLDVCQKLPSGFDQSIISELQDVSLDRQRISGGLSANSFRRNDYGLSPPTRGDATGYSRGSHGRWDSRSSVRGDRESDSQSDQDSDSGRRYGNQSKRPWQVPEHDGLLGSGSFPRPSGYAAGATASKLRPNEQYQLNKSNEPYHPPRPYKAAPYSRRETDSLNDETFGSSDCTSEDRAEEERKRRASFELMRQEQHKAFQEKQKLNIDKNKDDFTTMLEEDAKEEKRLLKRGNESDGIVKPLASDNDSGKPSVPFQTPAPRPLVPPGFTSTILDKNLGAKSSNQPHASEVGNPESEDDHLHAKSNHISNLTSINHEKQLAEEIGLSKQQHESASRQASINSQSGNGLDILSALDVSNKKFGIDSKLYNKTNLAQTFEASKSGETAELNVEKVARPSILGESNQDNSGSILEKLFGSALALNGAGSSAVVERQETKADEMSMNVGQSSKFARWFHEEERKPHNDQSSSRPNDLLSLIGGGEKDGSQVFGDKNENSLPNFLKNSEPIDRLGTSNVTTTTVGDSDQLYKNKPQVVSAVLTCEDLEQSILSEISENDSASKQQSEPPGRSWTEPDGKALQPKVKVDNHASLHLLSLLQKGTSLKDVESSPNMDSSSDNLHDIERASIGSAIHNTRESKVENISDAANNLTLETLFGTAFMKELQSVGAPVSIQRGPVGSTRVDASEPHGFPSLVMGDGLFPSKSESGLDAGVHDSNVLTANKRKPTKLDKIEQQWSGFDGAQADLNASQHRTNLGSKVGGFDAPADVRLPEEDSLISVSDPLNLENFLSSANSVKTELQATPSTQVDIAEKLASLNSAFRDERLMREGQEPPFLRGPYDTRGSNIPYQTHNIQPSLAQLHHSQMNNMGPMFRPIDSHPANVNPQMKFMAPEAINHRDPATSHQIPINMLRPPFHHPSTGLSGFDQPPIHHPMLQHMHMAGNFPPNMPQGLPRGGPSMPHHPNRGVPMPAHPNFGGLGMPQPGPDHGGGGNHPEALQRLIEMELRANSKKIHPFASGGQSPGMYGHELDMGFGFR